MALAKGRTPRESHMANTYFGNGGGGGSFSSSHHHISDLSDEAHSLISFKPSGYDSFMHAIGGGTTTTADCSDAAGSFLSFVQLHEGGAPQDYSYPRITSVHHHQDGQHHYSVPDQNQLTNLRLMENFNCISQATPTPTMNEVHQHHLDEPVGWLSADRSTTYDLGTQEASVHKRPHPVQGESMQPFKKQCTNATKKPKPKSTHESKDPQSIAAKNRRERISERLKILQDLVPNGSKVDMVTMLEKAINYVKFLQLQVKVLATDELWPAQGGKAPELSQVKEAIDAILASQRDTSSSSKC